MVERAPGSTWTFVRPNGLKKPEFTWSLKNGGTSIEIIDTPDQKKDHPYTITIRLANGKEATSPVDTEDELEPGKKPPTTTSPPMIYNE
jgi:hypothetical protein